MARPSKPWLRARDNYWWVTLNGQQVNLGVRGAQNEASAWRKFHRLRPELPRKPFPVFRPTKTPATVRQVVDAFLAHSVEQAIPLTMGQYRLFLLPFCDWYGDRLASDVTGPLVEAYSHSPNNPNKRKSVWGVATRIKFIATLKRAFRFAERSHLIDRSPLADLEPPPTPCRAAESAISEREYRQLYERTTPYFRPILEFLWLTDCSSAEASNLTAADVNWQASTATVRRHKKKGKSRTITIRPKVLKSLKWAARRWPTGSLFRNCLGNEWKAAALGSAMRAVCKKVGLKGLCVSGLRRQHPTQTLPVGAPSSHVEDQGHQPVSCPPSVDDAATVVQIRTDELPARASRESQLFVSIPASLWFGAETLGWG